METKAANEVNVRVPAVIMTWFIERGFGFAHHTDGDKITRYFIHISECSKRPREGDVVLLTPSPGRNGCSEPVGVNVVVQNVPTQSVGGAL